MANSSSAVYGFILPEVAADNNLWGTHLNQDLSVGGGGFPTIDQLLARPQWQRAVVSGGAVDLAQGQLFEMTVSGATVVTFANVPADPPGSGSNAHISSTILLKVINGAVGAITWPVSVTWITRDGSAPPQSAFKTAGVDLVLLFTNNNGTNWFGLMLTDAPSGLGVHVTRVAAQSLTAGADTAISFDTRDYDTSVGQTMWAAGANQTRLVAPTPGLYKVSFSWVAGATVAAGSVSTKIKKNGTTVLSSFNGPNITSPAASVIPGDKGSDVILLAAGDYIEVIVNSPATSLSTGAGIGTPFASLVRIGR